MPDSGSWASTSCRVLLVACCLSYSACSLPNLETQQCAEARNTVKRFYSLHFAQQQTPNFEYLKTRDELLSKRLVSELASVNADGQDYFTASEDFPKAFRVGACTVQTESAADLQVVLLWRDDTRNEQREVEVHTQKDGTSWVIDSVGN